MKPEHDEIAGPDLIWPDEEHLQSEPRSAIIFAFPETVVEVASPSNTLAELIDKRSLYFEQGAKEVWIYEETGAMLFYRADGKLSNSVLCPSFPQSVDA